MKKAVLFILFFSLGICLHAQQTKKYDSLWKNVNELYIKKGLTASAITEVKKIYALAKKEKQEAQQIKALISQLQLQERIEDNAEVKNLRSLELEVNAATEPSRSILSSLLAQKYWNYFQQHRWQLYNRTTTATTDENIENWSIADFHKKISALYLASVANERILQQTSLERFDPLIYKGNVRSLRPTLFDLLAHRALQYFRNDERDVIKPSYAFKINDAAAYGNASSFINHRFATADTLSLHYKALTIYQRLLSFHLSDSKPDAFIDADIQRIQFVQTHAEIENKDSLYLQSLREITGRYPVHPIAAQAWYLQAQWHADKAASYDALKDTTQRFAYVEAKRLAEKAALQTEASEGKTNARNLVKQIEKQSVMLSTEKVNVPALPFRTLVQHRNISKLYLRIVKMGDTLKRQLRDRYDETYWQRIVNLPAVRNWSQDLPSTNDFQFHKTEIKVDALPVGSYAMISSSDPSFPLDKSPLAVQHFYVSNISFIQNGMDYFVLHRQSGKPLANAAIQVWLDQYDYAVRRNTLRAAEKLNSDKNGFFKLVQKDRNGTTRLEIRHNNDRLFMDENIYQVYRDGDEEEAINFRNAETFERGKSRVFLFSDRSIYRPGQTVFFKGIAITEDYQQRKSKPYINKATVVFLYNANSEKVDSLEVRTNEYGSYSGKFRLPENVLNGEFFISDTTLHGQLYVSVEEYKRPKFYVSYDTLRETYKVNDTVRITGIAKAYAGNNISGAQVSYRVVRESRFIYPWRLWKIGFPRTSRMQVAYGTAVTDADGKFQIAFKAIPDLSINKQLDPVFDYRIITDITDLNGETRSGEQRVSISYKALRLRMDITEGESIHVDSLTSLPLTSETINGVFLPALVHLEITKLKTPDRLIRNRYWSQPDQFVMTKEEFLRNFPQDEYANEADYHTWQKAEKVFERTDSTKLNGRFEVGKKLDEGWYVIEAITTDRYGQEVKEVTYIQVYDETNQKPAYPLYSWIKHKKIRVEPGQKSTIVVASSAYEIFLVQHVHKVISQVARSKKDSSVYRFLDLNNEKKSFDFEVTENDRGGFGVNHFFVKDNRFYSLSNVVEVPWTNKELLISYGSFRDKTMPGSEEKWTVKISGAKNEKVAAELVASMYDASLDQFKPHAWQVPDVWPIYSGSFPWNGLNSFADVQSNERYVPEKFEQYLKQYDEMRIENLSYGRGLFDRLERSAAPMAAGIGVQDAVVTAQANGKRDRYKKTFNQEGKEEESEIDIPGLAEAVTADAPLQLRKNFNETAFFFPDLKTDAEGNIAFGFTIPEALTRWKFQALALSQEAAFGFTSKEIITQKELMVQPNTPRFLREGDRIELSTKVVNLSNKEITGTVHLELLNALTMQPVDGWFHNVMPNQYFTAEAGKSVVANFSIEVPFQYNSALIYRFVAKSATAGISLSDGEEASLPVLTNNMLVTETLPLQVRGNGTKNFSFDKLLQSTTSTTLKHQALTLEFTTNPAWYAVQALPLLGEVKYESADNFFNRYYANALAFKIANASPRLMQVFSKWKTTDTAALLSNLEKNQELKAVLLQETPWVLEAKSEAQQKRNIALLFDMARMGSTLQSSLLQLKSMQSPNGGFVWFKGGPDDRYITQYIITGLGHLKKLDASPQSLAGELDDIIKAGVNYLDQRIKEDYDKLVKKKADLKKNNLGYLQVQYLYARSFFNNLSLPGGSFTAVNYFRKQSQQYWLNQSRYMQGMIALSLFRTGDKNAAVGILKSLKENAILSEELGMYWKDNRPGYYWYQAPVETHSLLMEVFNEVGNDEIAVNDLKTWLLKQKQTQLWKTNKATAEACYALLITAPFRNTENSWLDNQPTIEIKLGEKLIRSTDQKQEAGTGYFKNHVEGGFVTPSMGNISVNVSGSTVASPVWGAVYWQYFENLDKITSAASPLKLVKKLFVEKQTDRGGVLQPVQEGYVLKPGDKIKVRIELSVDRDMEYVHMKDMRASCMEPVNVISSYKWQGGLGYYETTKDASTNFFFNRLPKGSYVFEYPLFVSQRGNYSNGITSVQCLYAPEFSSHSEGVRVAVE